METFDTDQTATQVSRFCPECGQPAGGSNFCPSCGHNMGFSADRTLADTNLQPTAGGGKSRGRAGFVIAGGVLGLLAIAVAVIVLLNSGKSHTSLSGASPASAGVTYQQQLTKALTPLISANQALSNSLTALNGASQMTNSAKTRATEALAALSSAHGGVGVLNAPAGQSTLSGQVQQALTADNGYLQAVSSTLATPSGDAAGQLQTLSTGAQSAFVNLNSVASGASNSISGTDNLVNWAQGAKGAAHAAAKSHAAKSTASPGGTTNGGGAGSGGSGGSGGAATSPAPTPQGMSACDQNISVNASTTSCGFADAVFAAYAGQVQANGGPLSTTVTATSAATGQTYDDYCAYNSSDQIVECSHGTDLIQFPEWAAAVYNG